ncbi:PAAR domain-containing protein [Longitalea luteola]|uniref:PAAR domain-containing protein n=1 Tax=Longitalea luteola TaxID=2812563 RepID=UPI001A96C5F4|nr:M35 family metallo-endopeptidase [Longitalea luteola]
MGKPAARIGDKHVCLMVAPGGVPHEGGPITGPGSSTVFIEGVSAAVAGDNCMCVGAMDTIISGSGSVYIGGKPAARKGEQCTHGGNVLSGSGTVFIGGRTVRIAIEIKNPEFVEPSAEQKAILIEQAIKDCIVLLEKKLALMECGDEKTMLAFKKWFGSDDQGAVKKILDRIRKALNVSKTLKIDNFSVIINEKDRMGQYANSYPNDPEYRILLGDRFWEEDIPNKKTKSSVIIHELSHFNEVGATEDVIYGHERCLILANDHPHLAMQNAESFECFIIA